MSVGLLAAWVIGIALSGCGGESAGDAVARVAGVAIAKSTLEHWMGVEAAESDQVVPDPPGYSRCTVELREAVTGQSMAALKRDCERSYEALQAKALEFLIKARWLIGEAAREGVSVDESAVQAAFQRISHSLYRQESEFRRFLSSEHETVSDVLLRLRLERVTEALHKKVLSKARPVGEADVAAYYASHKARFARPERRDFRIIRTSHVLRAKRVKEEVRSGRSFASVVAEVPISQPIDTRAGLFVGYLDNFFQEKSINDAIMTARTHVLEGPVFVRGLGYYVFEVTRIAPAHEQSLSEAQASIKKQLIAERPNQTLARFIAAWRASWRAQTSCRPGYVIPKCREYRHTGATPPEEPLSFT